MANPIGRPMKYRQFILILQDDLIYTPATIVRNGEAKGLISPILRKEGLKQERLRIRHALARFSANHYFPREGDGWVSLRGQPPLRGWFGWRWKDDLPRYS